MKYSLIVFKLIKKAYTKWEMLDEISPKCRESLLILKNNYEEF